MIYTLEIEAEGTRAGEILAETVSERFIIATEHGMMEAKLRAVTEQKKEWTMTPTDLLYREIARENT